MKIVVLTSENEAPLDRDMLELAGELRDDGSEVESYLWEDEESDSQKALYDIYQSPALILTNDSGSVIELWQGKVPSASEVRYRSSGA